MGIVSVPPRGLSLINAGNMKELIDGINVSVPSRGLSLINALENVTFGTMTIVSVPSRGLSLINVRATSSKMKARMRFPSPLGD